MQVEDLYIKGFTHQYDPTVYDLITPLLKDIDWEYEPEEKLNIPVFTKELNDAMLQAHEYLGRTYVSQLRPEYELGYRHLWERTADPVHEWHNDLIEGCNVFFLCYLTDVSEGGEICFRSRSRGNLETGRLQPRKGMIVMASQQKDYQHRVTPHPETETRMLCNFGFNVKDF